MSGPIALNTDEALKASRNIEEHLDKMLAGSKNLTASYEAAFAASNLNFIRALATEQATMSDVLRTLISHMKDLQSGLKRYGQEFENYATGH